MNLELIEKAYADLAPFPDNSGLSPVLKESASTTTIILQGVIVLIFISIGIFLLLRARRK